jgi:hypothetical protein
VINAPCSAPALTGLGTGRTSKLSTEYTFQRLRVSCPKIVRPSVYLATGENVQRAAYLVKGRFLTQHTLTGCAVIGKENQHIKSQEREHQEPSRAMVASPPIFPVHVVAKTLLHCQRSRCVLFRVNFLEGHP